VHLAGHKNVVADASSRLELNENSLEEHAMVDILTTEVTPFTYPLQLKRITEFQQEDKDLLQRATFNQNSHLKSFSGDRKVRTLI